MTTSKNSEGNSQSDIAGRDEIVRLVNAFYDRVQKDELIGFIFNDVALVNWETHLPKMYAFWETVLFGKGVYSGNPVASHAQLAGLTSMGLPQFERWIALFKATVDDLFSGPNSDHIKRAAEDMAHVIHARVNNVPDARFDPARLTPEQRARYAKYKAGSTAA